MLKKIIKENRLKSKAVFGIFPARTNQNDEIEVYDPINKDLLNKFICLRQQTVKATNIPNLSICDLYHQMKKLMILLVVLPFHLVSAQMSLQKFMKIKMMIITQ